MTDVVPKQQQQEDVLPKWLGVRLDLDLDESLIDSSELNKTDAFDAEDTVSAVLHKLS